MLRRPSAASITSKFSHPIQIGNSFGYFWQDPIFSAIKNSFKFLFNPECRYRRAIIFQSNINHTQEWSLKSLFEQALFDRWSPLNSNMWYSNDKVASLSGHWYINFWRKQGVETPCPLGIWPWQFMPKQKGVLNGSITWMWHCHEVITEFSIGHKMLL